MWSSSACWNQLNTFLFHLGNWEDQNKNRWGLWYVLVNDIVNYRLVKNRFLIPRHIKNMCDGSFGVAKNLCKARVVNSPSHFRVFSCFRFLETDVGKRCCGRKAMGGRLSSMSSLNSVFVCVGAVAGCWIGIGSRAIVEGPLYVDL